MWKITGVGEIVPTDHLPKPKAVSRRQKQACDKVGAGEEVAIEPVPTRVARARDSPFISALGVV